MHILLNPIIREKMTLQIQVHILCFEEVFRFFFSGRFLLKVWNHHNRKHGISNNLKCRVLTVNLFRDHSWHKNNLWFIAAVKLTVSLLDFTNLFFLFSKWEKALFLYDFKQAKVGNPENIQHNLMSVTFMQEPDTLLTDIEVFKFALFHFISNKPYLLLKQSKFSKNKLCLCQMYWHAAI